MATLKRLGLALASTLAALLFAGAVFEILARTLLFRPELEPQNLQPAAGVAFADAGMLESWHADGASYRGRPLAQVTIDGIEYRHDSLGLRDQELGPRALGEIRILILGDSNTYAWRVNADQGFCAVTQRLLNERFAKLEPTRVVRCVNAGLPGYNTDDALRRYRSLRERIAPDVVVLAWMLNDCERFGFEVDDQGFLYFDSLAVPDHWKPRLWRSYGYRLWSWTAQSRLRSSGQLEVSEPRNIEFTLSRVDQLASECRGHGERFLLVDLPLLEPDPGSQRISVANYRAREMSDRLVAFVREHSIPFVSFLPAIDGEGVALLWASIDPPDHHPNARAHAKFAAALAQFLSERVLPP